MIVQNQEGSLITIDIPAETYVEEDEEENENNKNNKKINHIIKCNSSKVMQNFTSGIVFLKEFKT